MTKAKSSEVTAERFDLSCPFEVVCDHNMAEYYPEIRRVVSVWANPLPDSKFLSSGTLEFGGCVEFTMLYIGEDGSLSHLTCSCEYSERTALPEEIRGVSEASVDVYTVDTSFRVTAPRRVTLRAKLRARIISDKVISLTESVMEGEKPCDMATCRTVKSLRKSIPTVRRGFTSQTCNVSGEHKCALGTKILSCPGAVSISEVRARSGAATVRGDVVLKCLVFSENGGYSSQKIKMPFEEVVSDDTISEGDMILAYGRVASAAVKEDANDSGTFVADAEFDLNLKWMRGDSCNILCDAYSTSWSMANEHTDIPALSPLCCTSSPLSVSGTGKRSSRGETGEYLVDVDMMPRFEKVECEDGKAVFVGTVTVRAYIAGGGDVLCEEFSLPLKFETSCEDGCGEAVWWASASVCDAYGGLEGDGIAVNGELSVSVCAVRKNKISPVTVMQINKGEARYTDESELRVIYPDGGESVWSIAKACGADIDGVERLNGVCRTDLATKPVVLPLC